VDLRAVKAAPGPELVALAIAAASNAQGLVQDAELLAGSGRAARAYSLAVLAVEECGKAATVSCLAVMPQKLRARAPLGRMLAWHQLKLVGGLLIAMLRLGNVASRLAVMPDAEVEQILGDLAEPADEADFLRRRGLYADMDLDGQIRKPSEITESEVISLLSQARQAAASASVLLDPPMQAQLLNPPAKAVEFVQELVSALNAAGDARTPKAAADVLLRAACKFRARNAPTGPVVPRQAGEWREGRPARPSA